MSIHHSGGLELLFSSQRSHKIALPSTDPSTNLPANVGFLIDWLCKNLMKDPRQDMFVLEGTVWVFIYFVIVVQASASLEDDLDIFSIDFCIDGLLLTRMLVDDPES
jgi:hypothetical protein